MLKNIADTVRASIPGLDGGESLAKGRAEARQSMYLSLRKTVQIAHTFILWRTCCFLLSANSIQNLSLYRLDLVRLMLLNLLRVSQPSVDAAYGDSLGEMRVTGRGFATMAQTLLGLESKRIF